MEKEQLLDSLHNALELEEMSTTFHFTKLSDLIDQSNLPPEITCTIKNHIQELLSSTTQHKEEILKLLSQLKEGFC